LLALFAGAVGLLLSIWGTKFLAALIPVGFAPITETGVDGRVLLFTLFVSLATGILFGIIPASRVSQFELTYSLKQGGGQSGVGSGGYRLRDALVIGEVALAIVLLAGAALLMRSLENLYHTDPGFRADHVLVMRTPLPRPKYEAVARRRGFFDQVLAKVESLPGVVSAGYTTWVPLTNDGGATGITIEGKPEPAPGNLLIPNVRIISRDYMPALRMKLIDGRALGSRDANGTLPVGLVNQTMARNYWPGENPIDRRFKIGRYGGSRSLELSATFTKPALTFRQERKCTCRISSRILDTSRSISPFEPPATPWRSRRLCGSRSGRSTRSSPSQA